MYSRSIKCNSREFSLMDETSRIKWAKKKGNALMKLSALKEWILNRRNLEIS